MSDPPASLVIRRAPTLRGRLLVCAAVVAGVIAFGGLYELGRYRGGYDMLTAARQRSELVTTKAQLEAANRTLRKQVAELDAMRVGRTEERAALAHTIGGLQAQVAAQAEELTFYRDVVSHGGSRADPAIGLSLTEVRISAAQPPGHFDVHLTLLQTAHPQAPVSGSWQLRVEGRAKGKAATLDLAALGAQGSRQPFAFRYFQTLDQVIAVPAGFKPQRLTIEVDEKGEKRPMPLIRTFPWRVESP
ncbi:MAG: DUF6776 family protein [Steroidobacteraceae bacterium]